MGTRRKKYDREFRLEAIRLASDPNTTAGVVERDLGLYQGAISHWKKEFKDNPVNAFPGQGRLKPEQEEIRCLRRELERTKRERDILKKAAAYFSMDSIKDSRS